MTEVFPSSEHNWRADDPRSSNQSESEGHRILAESVIEQLQSTAQLLRSRLEEHFQSFDLNEIRFTVLNIVHQSAPHGCSQTELAEKLEQSESSISTLVERMRSDDLIYRLRSRIDRRKRVLILTDRGNSILKPIKACHLQRLEQMLCRFDQDCRKELTRLLSLLTLSLQNYSSNDQTKNSSEIPAPHLLQNLTQPSRENKSSSSTRH